MQVEITTSPWGKQKLRGVKREGIVFQQKVADFLAKDYPIERDLWLKTPVGHRSPDILVRLPSAWVVVECKRTWREDAWEQISTYRRLIAALWNRPTYGLLVCMNLVPWFTGDLVTSIEDSLSKERPTWHLAIR